MTSDPFTCLIRHATAALRRVSTVTSHDFGHSYSDNDTSTAVLHRLKDASHIRRHEVRYRSPILIVHFLTRTDSSIRRPTPTSLSSSARASEDATR